MGAPLKLERFDLAADPLPVPVHTRQDLDDALARGIAEGRRAAEAEQTQAICAALAELSARLEAQDALRDSAGAAQARIMAPLIEALLDGIVPAIARAKVQASLELQLSELAAAVSPLRARIRCGPDLAASVAGCIARIGLESIVVDPSAPNGQVAAELTGGLVTWDVAAVADQLRDLFLEMMEKD